MREFSTFLQTPSIFLFGFDCSGTTLVAMTAATDGGYRFWEFAGLLLRLRRHEGIAAAIRGLDVGALSWSGEEFVFRFGAK